MKRNDSALVVGGLMVIGGVLFLLMNLGILNFLSGIFFAGLFGLGGLAFLYLVIQDREKWWALIPAFVLMGLGGTILVDDVLGLNGLGGFIFLGSIGVGFFAVYLLHQENWWALIPGGVMSTLAIVALLDELFNTDSPVLFFLGLAATFGLVYLLPSSRGRMAWALYPALGLLALALLVSVSMGGLVNYIWPVALIGGGLYLVLRRQPRDEQNDKSGEETNL